MLRQCNAGPGLGDALGVALGSAAVAGAASTIRAAASAAASVSGRCDIAADLRCTRCRLRSVRSLLGRKVEGKSGPWYSNAEKPFASEAFMMFSQILDIAIVLVAVYATLSCVCSWVHEKIAKFLELRGWNLFRGILQLTGDHDLAADIFNHPLVATTSPDPTKKVDSKDGSGKISWIAQYSSVRASKPPSYLDARNFSSAFWHQVLVYPSSVIAKKAAAALAAAKKPPTPDAQDGAEPAPAEAGTA